MITPRISRFIKGHWWIYCLIVAIATFCHSCHTKEMTKRGYNVDLLEMELYQVHDSLLIDSLIRISKYEHEKLTGEIPICFRFCQLKNNQKLLIESGSLYPGIAPDITDSKAFGVACFNGSIILISKMNFPMHIFASSKKTVYVMFISGDGGYTNCLFDSKFHLIQSENAIKGWD